MTYGCVIEKDWTTKAGLRAACLFVIGSHRCGYVEVPVGHPLYFVIGSHRCGYVEVPVGHPLYFVIGNHRCGYVEVPVGHPLYGVDYQEETEAIPRTVQMTFDVHGSVTFSGSGSEDYPIKSEGWWFGFDCAHSGDKTSYFQSGIERTEDYVVEQCEYLAQQIVDFEVPATIIGD